MSEIPREEDPQDPPKKEEPGRKYSARRICSSCEAYLGESSAEYDEPGQITHGLCEKCARQMYGDETFDKVISKKAGGEKDISRIKNLEEPDKYSNKDIDKNSITENQD